jgi:hypothetical protein
MKKKSYIALVAVIAAALVYQASSYPARSNDDDQEELITEACVAVVVIGVGAVIVTNIKKLCDRINPPKKPTGHHAVPQPIAASISTQTASTQGATFNFDDSAVTCLDISDFSTNAAFFGPDGLQYTLYFSYAFRTSPDLRTWTTNYVRGYLSPTWTHTSVGTNAVLTQRPYSPAFMLPTNGSSIFYQPVP